MRGIINKEYKGAVSIYLCLVLAVLIPLITMMIEAARYSAMKLQIECAVDTAADSAMAEYHRELLDEYGLLFVDTSYKSSSGSVSNVSNHISSYINANMQPTEKDILSVARDLYGLRTDTVDITGVALATDNEGEVFKYMAVSYMEEYLGYAYVEDLLDVCEETASGGIFDIDIEKELDSAMDAFSSYSFSEEDMDTYELTEEPDFDNPSEGIEEIRSKDILEIVCDGGISGKTITPELYVSSRSLVKGNGMYEKWEDRNSMLSEMLFNEYILQMCGNYLQLKEDSLLDYQVEYILFGNNNDTENLKVTAAMLLGIRGGANLIYLMGDEEKMDIIEQLSEDITVLFPPLQSVVETLLMMIWVYGESIIDVKQLMHGGSVSINTTDEEWDLSLENCITSISDLITGDVTIRKDPGGSYYKDYLRLLLFVSNKEEKVMRCMDIVEMDIRKHTGINDFRLDNCAAAFNMQAIVESSAGYEFIVKRDFGYR